jgi:hypothetical protein
MALVTAAGDYFVVKWNRRKIQPNNRLFFWVIILSIIN